MDDKSKARAEVMECLHYSAMTEDTRRILTDKIISWENTVRINTCPHSERFSSDLPSFRGRVSGPIVGAEKALVNELYHGGWIHPDMRDRFLYYFELYKREIFKP